MPNKKLNLKRMYNDLVETYWLENECLKKAKETEPYRCYEILQTREAKLCGVCKGFTTLKQSMRYALEESSERRKNQEVTTIQ